MEYLKKMKYKDRIDVYENNEDAIYNGVDSTKEIDVGSWVILKVISMSLYQTYI